MPVSQKRSWLSSITFGWASEFLRTGSKKILEDSDLGELNEEEEAQRLIEDLQEQWKEEKIRAGDNLRSPKLWKALLRVTSLHEYFVLFATALVESVCRISQPVFLVLFLNELSYIDHSKPDRWVRIAAALLYALVLCLCALGVTVATHQYLFNSCRLGMLWRVAVTGVLYKKVVGMNQKDIGEVTIGHIINLLSNDSQRFDSVFKYLLYIILVPVEIVIVSLLIWRIAGFPAISGIAFMVLIIPFAITLGNVSGKLRQRTADLTDRRLSLINEVISGIQVIKIHAWEDTITEKVKKRRSKEMRTIRWKSAVIVLLEQMYKLSVVISTFISLLAMVWSGLVLTPVRIFAILSFFAALQLSVSHYCADAIRLVYECSVSLRRIETFLLINVDVFGFSNHQFSTYQAREMLQSSFKLPVDQTPYQEKTSIGITNMSCWWNEENGTILSDLNLKIACGSLTVITGPVGAGKSSLLLAMLGELPHQKGHIVNQGEMIYVPQQPWVISGTLRENILFGSALDLLFYKRVVRACALEHDLKELPQGDLTLIGARGLTLSGGQRARVSLARAVYSRANTILLDDPLSKVDAVVGHHIFENCINGILTGSTRILVTHDLRYLKRADHVIVMESGKIRADGKYSELDCAELERWVKHSSYVDNEVYEEGFHHEIKMTTKEVQHNEKTTTFEPEQYTAEDDGIQGSTSWRTYYEYLRAGLPLPCLVVLAVLLIITQASYIITNWWLTRWTKLSSAQQRESTPIYIYTGLILGTILLAVSHTFMYFATVLNASKILHEKLLTSILRTNMKFFHSNPTGRILNRFSRDIGKMDEELPVLMLDAIHHIIFVLGAVVLASATNFWVLIAAVPLAVVFAFLGRYYLRVSREVSRLEAVNRSPVYSHFSSTLQGLVTIRSAKMQERFLNALYTYQDRHSRSWLVLIGCSRWLAFRLEAISVGFIASIAICALVFSTDPALTGLALTYAIQLVRTVQWAVRELVEVENMMTSVERVLFYSQLPCELGYHNHNQPPDDWPTIGQVKFENVSLSYGENANEILHDVNISIAPTEKVGVVGRTGAGKSSLMAAMFRLEEPKGSIVMDGIDICKINIRAGRRCISAIPQEPVLFSGTLRYNLDPYKTLKDRQIWEVLEAVHLKDFVSTLPGQLNFELKESGTNLSCGERQLICLVRASLQQNKVIVMDEATANVDIHTDHIIQQAIASEFNDRTVITIAHRIHTILNYDKVIVMDKGRVVEFDSPKALMDRTGSLFSHLYQLSQNT